MQGQKICKNGPSDTLLKSFGVQILRVKAQQAGSTLSPANITKNTYNSALVSCVKPYAQQLRNVKMMPKPLPTTLEKIH